MFDIFSVEIQQHPDIRLELGFACRHVRLRPSDPLRGPRIVESYGNSHHRRCSTQSPAQQGESLCTPGIGRGLVRREYMGQVVRVVD